MGAFAPINYEKGLTAPINFHLKQGLPCNLHPSIEIPHGLLGILHQSIEIPNKATAFGNIYKAQEPGSILKVFCFLFSKYLYFHSTY